MSRHITWDIGIAGVAGRLADKLDAALIMQTYSRLVIDCNRPPGSPTSIAPLSEGTPIPGNENISMADAVGAPARDFHAVSSGHREASRRARASASADVFDFAAQLHARSMAGIPRPWQAGVLYNRNSKLAHALRDLLRETG